jgi:ribosomal-protein-serine acetyltransferase
MLAIPPRAELVKRPLESQRLVLQAIDPLDGPEIWEAVDRSRRTLSHWLPWVHFNQDPSSSDRFADACAREWEECTGLRFCIRDKASRQLLGIVSLERCSLLNRSCELGYWLRNEVVGRGYMTEAAQAVLHFAFARLGAHRVRVAAATDNHRSLAVIARLGFRFEGIARDAEWCDGRWLDHAIYGRLATDRT